MKDVTEADDEDIPSRKDDSNSSEYSYGNSINVLNFYLQTKMKLMKKKTKLKKQS